MYDKHSFILSQHFLTRFEALARVYFIDYIQNRIYYFLSTKQQF